jgi:flagellar motor protein MotB
MVTYEDLMTLLLCFFVLLFSFSTMDVIQFESMKESFTGAFGMMDGHFVINAKGVSNQTQRWTSKLFDSALAKIRKAKSDKFPHEQLEYLNSQVKQLEEVIGILRLDIELVLGGVESLDHLSPTVREKSLQEFAHETEEQSDRKEYKLTRREEDGEIEEDSQTLDFKNPSVSSRQGLLELRAEDQFRNFEDEKPDKQKLARPDKYMEKKGDATDSMRNPGRNELLARSSGQNEVEEMSTGEDLEKDEKMDIVEGLGQKKRFEFEVPRRIASNMPLLNFSGAFPDRPADANRYMQVLMEIPARELFKPQSSELLTGQAELLLKEFFDYYYQPVPDTYYQIESFTSDYGRSIEMSVNLVRKILDFFANGGSRQKYEVNPSSFAAVGWADRQPELSRGLIYEGERGSPDEWVLIKMVSFR